MYSRRGRPSEYELCVIPTTMLKSPIVSSLADSFEAFHILVRVNNIQYMMYLAINADYRGICSLVSLINPIQIDYLDLHYIYIYIYTLKACPSLEQMKFSSWLLVITGYFSFPSSGNMFTYMESYTAGQGYHELLIV